MSDILFIQKKIEKFRKIRRRILFFSIILITVGVVAIVGKFVIGQINVFNSYSTISASYKKSKQQLETYFSNSKDLTKDTDSQIKSLDEYKSLDESNTVTKKILEKANTISQKYSFGTTKANKEMADYTKILDEQNVKLKQLIVMYKSKVIDVQFNAKVDVFKQEINTANNLFTSTAYKVRYTFREPLLEEIKRAQNFLEENVEKIDENADKNNVMAQIDQEIEALKKDSSELQSHIYY